MTLSQRRRYPLARRSPVRPVRLVAHPRTTHDAVSVRDAAGGHRRAHAGHGFVRVKPTRGPQRQRGSHRGIWPTRQPLWLARAWVKNVSVRFSENK